MACGMPSIDPKRDLAGAMSESLVRALLHKPLGSPVCV